MPDAHDGVVIAGGDACAVWGPGDREHFAAVITVRPLGIPNCALPDLDGPTGIGCSDRLPIRGPGDAIDPPIAAIDPDGSACGSIPNLHTLIKAYRGDMLAIRRPGDRRDTGNMA